MRFDKNDYSIPFEYVGKPTTIRANDSKVRVFSDGVEIAVHDRCFAKDKRIRNPEHTYGLVAQRPKGFSATLQDTLVTLIPESADLIGMLIEEGQPTGRHISKILELVDDYGVKRVKETVKIAISNNMPRSTTIAQMLAQAAQREKFIHRPEIILPDRPGVIDLKINPHDLSTYDELSQQGDNEDDI